MQILMAGSSGFIGRALRETLNKRGVKIRRLVRRQSVSPDEFSWDPASGTVDKAAFKGIDAIINLAGENVAAGRWTEKRKNLLRLSRVNSTELLCKAAAALKTPPACFINASGIGYYGNRPDELLTEASLPGTGFLAGLAQDWERPAADLGKLGIRELRLRFGMVLGKDGGALQSMLPVFRLGLGGKFGSGKQYTSWISIHDLTSSVAWLLETPLAGAVNIVAPEAVTNRDFTLKLAGVLHRPAFFAIPAPAARMMFGEMADEMLLASTRVKPERLLQEGFEFSYPDLESALCRELAQ